MIGSICFYRFLLIQKIIILPSLTAVEEYIFDCCELSSEVSFPPSIKKITILSSVNEFGFGLKVANLLKKLFLKNQIRYNF